MTTKLEKTRASSHQDEVNGFCSKRLYFNEYNFIMTIKTNFNPSTFTFNLSISNIALTSVWEPRGFEKAFAN